MTSLAAITLAAPLMLLGLGLLALPVIAHLLNRRARRQVVFPSLWLIDEASASQSNLFRMRRWLLLMLRCLIVALIVLGFASPMWVQDRTEAATGADRVAVVLVLDVSASTAQQPEGIPALQSMRVAADRTLDALLTGADVANVVFASASPRAPFAELTSNVSAIRREIAAVGPTYDRADFAQAFAVAGDMLVDHAGPRHVVVLSDFQRTNWDDVPAALAARQPLPTDTRVTVVPLDVEPAGNVALSRPQLDPPRPMGGTSATASVRVTNFSDRSRTVQVTLRVDGEARDAQAVSLDAWAQRRVEFDVVFEQPGERELVFAIGDDALAADNRAYSVATVRDRARVVLISDENPQEPGTSAYFLMRALAPHRDARDTFDVAHVASAEADAGDLHDAAAVLVSGAADVSTSLAEALRDYVDRGGGLAIFAGGAETVAALDRLDAAGDGAVSPVTLSARRDLAARGQSLSFDEGDWESGLLEVFDPRSRATLRSARIRRAWGVDELREGTRVYLRYDDGSPALLGAEGVAGGAGRVVFANFSAALMDGDLAQLGSFVALTQSLATHLQAAPPPDATHDAGRAVTLRAFEPGIADRAGELRIIDPAGEAVLDADYARLGGGLLVSVSPAQRPGFYRLVDGDRVIASAAVNVDPRESDLRALDPAEIETMLTTHDLPARTRAATADEPVLNLRGTPLWGWMLLAALALVAMELLLLSWWRR